MMFASALVSVFCFAPHVLLALGALLFWRYCRAAYRAPDIDAKGKWVLVTGAARYFYFFVSAAGRRSQPRAAQRHRQSDDAGHSALRRQCVGGRLERGGAQGRVRRV